MRLLSVSLWVSLIVPAGGCAAGTGDASQAASRVAPQEKQCLQQGWRRVAVRVAGQERRLLWKGPEGPWSKGAILVLHGGGGHHFHWCVANAAIVAPQVRFTELAVAKGFAVFLLDSTDRVTDNEGRICGKVWDDEVRQRPNLDLPFIAEVIKTVIPRLRPPGSEKEIFMTGLSSGGYMTVRAATHYNHAITAFAPVSSGDPYGWHRLCEPGTTRRKKVHGAGYDNETGKQIIEIDSCRSPGYPREKPWDGGRHPAMPVFRMFHHRFDGINDYSCGEKVRKQLRAHGYPESPPFVLQGDGQRRLRHHFWQDEYSRPLLEFFASQRIPGRR